MPDGYFLSPQDFALFQKMKALWPKVQDVINRVLNLSGTNGAFVSNTPAGIVISAPKASGRTASTEGSGFASQRFKITTATDTNGAAIGKQVDSFDAEVSGTETWIRTTIPAKVGEYINAVRVTPSAGIVSVIGSVRVLWQEVPGGIISSPTTLGSNTEGTEAASTVAGSSADDGTAFDIWIQTRQAYFDAGDKKWYAYAKKFRFNSRGILYAVTGETRIVIDDPTSCASSFSAVTDDQSDLAYLMS